MLSDVPCAPVYFCLSALSFSLTFLISSSDNDPFLQFVKVILNPIPVLQCILCLIKLSADLLKDMGLGNHGDDAARQKWTSEHDFLFS